MSRYVIKNGKRVLDSATLQPNDPEHAVNKAKREAAAKEAAKAAKPKNPTEGGKQ